jgi:hypothetical protein
LRYYAGMKLVSWGAALACLAFAVGCSSTKADTTAPTADASIDSGPQVSADNCVKAGDPGNELGIGAYCVRGQPCKSSSLFCTADRGFDTNKWFCSATCGANADCGSNAYCAKLGCVPLACQPPAADAGTIDSGDPGPVPFDAGYDPDALPTPGN